MAINSITISGNLVRDPELRAIEGGGKMLPFTIGVTDFIKGKTTSYYFEIIAFDSLAEQIVNKFSKGDQIVINGKITQYKYKETTKTRIIANTFTGWFGKDKSKAATASDVYTAPTATKTNKIEEEYNLYSENDIDDNDFELPF